MNKLKVIYLGEFFQKDLFPMRGIAQSIFREYARTKNLSLGTKVITRDYQDNYELISKANVIMIPLELEYDKELFKFIRDNRFLHSLVGAISVEGFDFMYQKGNYQYFNHSIRYLYNKMWEYHIVEKIDFTISSTPRAFSQGIPHIYYPYLFAPSVFEDKITFMRRFIIDNPAINYEDTTRSGFACMVYNFPNQFRYEIADRVQAYMKENHLNKIVYGGSWRNNDTGIKSDYNFDIIKEYYTKFCFNIAVEDEYVDGLITEKLINPLIAGTIPIYYCPFPERNPILEMFNKEAICFIDDYDLYSNPNSFDEKLSKHWDRWKTSEEVVHPFIDDALLMFNQFVGRIIKRLEKLIQC